MAVTNFVAILLLLSLGNLAGLAEQSASRPSALLTKKQAKALESTATTQHLSLSAYYREEARKFEQKVRYHEEMGGMYRRSPLPSDGEMPVPMLTHCKYWASHFAERWLRTTRMACLNSGT